MIKAFKRWMFGDSRRGNRCDFELEALYRADLALILDGWKPWFSLIGPQPWDYQVIKIRRRDSPVTITAYDAIPKEMNWNGLYWRPWDGPTLDGRERHEGFFKGPVLAANRVTAVLHNAADTAVGAAKYDPIRT
jgi:hypothetical protein